MHIITSFNYDNDDSDNKAAANNSSWGSRRDTFRAPGMFFWFWFCFYYTNDGFRLFYIRTEGVNG